MLRRGLVLLVALSSAALVPFGQGCGGKVTGLGSGGSSGGGADASDEGGTTSSSGISSSGSTGSGGSSGIVGSTSSGSGSGSSGGGSNSSGGSASSSGSGPPVDAGPGSCTDPASMVPSSEIPPYVNVVQQKGACSANEISGFINACDSTGASQAACTMWYQGASPTCLGCLGVTDAGATTSGGLWGDDQGNFIGANAPGCDAIVDGNTTCAAPYDEVVQCLFSAGCGACTSQPDFDTCEQQVFAGGGACASYYGSVMSACSIDFNADGGALNNGVCSTDTGVLSVICGNGSGDGG
ncbi:MAG TPA: hypothetical protein VMI75_15460 [Polyangiaceae bacterium]|nr:hypothetical protein [Polyangiaceae bacterium]